MNMMSFLLIDYIIHIGMPNWMKILAISSMKTIEMWIILDELIDELIMMLFSLIVVSSMYIQIRIMYISLPHRIYESVKITNSNLGLQ